MNHMEKRLWNDLLDSEEDMESPPIPDKEMPENSFLDSYTMADGYSHRIFNRRRSGWYIYDCEITGQTMVSNGSAEYVLDDAMQMLDDFLKKEISEMKKN